MIPQKQLTLADIFENCQDIFESDKPQFLTLLENHIDLDEIVPISFRNHYYASTGRNRKYPLNAMLWALIIQRLFSIPTDSLLLVFLHYSRHLREFCGFTKVPDASKFSSENPISLKHSLGVSFLILIGDSILQTPVSVAVIVGQI